VLRNDGVRYSVAFTSFPGTRRARFQRDHLPGTGRPGLRSLRQHTSVPGGASINLVALFGIVNSSVET
jgi:hypothetical protein